MSHLQDASTKELTTKDVDERLTKCMDQISTWEKRVEVWIIIFTLIVFLALFFQWRETRTRVKERNEQLAAIVDAGHKECVHAFEGMTAMLHIAVPDTKKFTPQQQERVNELFESVNPKSNCPPNNTKKKVLQQITTNGT